MELLMIMYLITQFKIIQLRRFSGHTIQLYAVDPTFKIWTRLSTSAAAKARAAGAKGEKQHPQIPPRRRPFGLFSGLYLGWLQKEKWSPRPLVQFSTGSPRPHPAGGATNGNGLKPKGGRKATNIGRRNDPLPGPP